MKEIEGLILTLKSELNFTNANYIEKLSFVSPLVFSGHLNRTLKKFISLVKLSSPVEFL